MITKARLAYIYKQLQETVFLIHQRRCAGHASRRHIISNGECRPAELVFAAVTVAGRTTPQPIFIHEHDADMRAVDNAFAPQIIHNPFAALQQTVGCNAVLGGVRRGSAGA